MLHHWAPELCRSKPQPFDLVLTLGGDGARSKTKGDQYEVLNEFAINCPLSPHASDLEIYGHGDRVTVVQVDGCIFFTPTGNEQITCMPIGWEWRCCLPG